MAFASSADQDLEGHSAKAFRVPGRDDCLGPEVTISWLQSLSLAACRRRGATLAARFLEKELRATLGHKTPVLLDPLRL